MNLFQWSEEELARYFVENESCYSAVSHFLKDLIKKDAVRPELKSGLEETLETMEKAKAIALDSQYFIFETYDTWAGRTGGNEFGYSVFQKVDENFERIIGVGDYGPPDMEAIIKLLEEKEITELVTLWIPPEGFCGLKKESFDEDGDGIIYDPVNDHDAKIFRDEGINITPYQNT